MRWWVGCGSPIRQEPKTSRHLPLAAARVHHGSRPAVVGRPDDPPVKANVVVDQRGRLEIIDQEQRVVMPFDRERRSRWPRISTSQGRFVSSQKLALSVPA